MDLSSLASFISLDTSLLEREAHARDLWPRRTLGLTRGELPPAPMAVAWPEDEAQVLRVLEWATARSVAVVPWGAGSGVCGAAEGHAAALALDLKRLRRIGGVDQDRHAVRVEAGVIGQHLEDALEVEGWATRHSPSSIWCSTVGGWAAGRSAGQFSSRYGKFEDMVLGMRVVAPSGRFGTGLWAEGEDLGPWVIGAEGALGVITELLVRVVPVAKSRWLRGYRFASVEAAWDAMRGLMQEGPIPAALRLYDPVDTRIAGKGTATPHRAAGEGWLRNLGARVDAVPALRRHLLSLPLALPRLVNALAEGISSGCVMIAGWEGEVAEVESASVEGHARVLAAGAEDLGAGPGEHWYAHRHEVSYKLAPIFERGGFADTMEVAALWSRLPELYARVRQALARHTLVMAHFSHAYPEGCSIYFSFAGLGDEATYDAAWAAALEAARDAGGTVAHHHGVGQLKMAAAARELAAIAPQFHAFKRRLDPAGILNPGRMFAGPAPSHAEEGPVLPVGIDPVSRVATLDAQASAVQRDVALAAAGWRLRFPTSLPLAATLAEPVAPWERRVLGVTVRSNDGIVCLPAVPRSAAGPDPRAWYPADAYVEVTVPVLPLTDEGGAA